jgi:hypothetical protein
VEKMKEIIFLLVCVQRVKICESVDHEIFLKSNSTPVNEDLTSAINYVLEEIYLKRYTTVNIITAAQNTREPFLLDIKDSLMKKNKGFCIYRMDNHTKIQRIRFRLKIYNVFLIDSFETFKELDPRINATAFNIRGYYLFVFFNGLIPEINEVFASMWKKNIINANVLYDDNGVVRLGTYRPFRRSRCYSTHHEPRAHFANGTFNVTADKVFAEKTKNLFKCKVRMVTFHRCPAACVSYSSANISSMSGLMLKTYLAIKHCVMFSFFRF